MEFIEYRELDSQEIETVSGGFVCGGLCILGGIAAGVAIFKTGIEIGKEIQKAAE